MIDFLNKFATVDSKTINTFSAVFEDNSSASQLALEPRCRPRTRDTCVKHHHFSQHVKNKTISMQAIGTDDQQADAFTKPLAKEKFKKFHRLLMG